MRNIRDYKAQIRPDSESLGSASPFNIITESLTLKNFTKKEIGQLYSQHTDETGQVFEDDAIELVWEQTQGQPWLVNAIAYEVITRLLKSDYAKPVTAELVNQAIQNIILTRPVHIDYLLEHLTDREYRKMIETIISSKNVIDTVSNDFLYLKDLGLIRTDNTQIELANPIYNEAIVRRLSAMSEENSKQQNKYYNDEEI
jgi:ABC-type ATPase with predicted acetyltransferase domain